MQSLTAFYNSALNDLWVGGSKEDGPPNHSIYPVDHRVPPIILQSIRAKIRARPIGIQQWNKSNAPVLSVRDYTNNPADATD
jgi:hypothetical protein